MLKNIFTMFAVLVMAAQFSVASADVAFGDRVPISPVEIRPGITKNNFVNIHITRKFDIVESYSYKIYRKSDNKILSEGENIKFEDQNHSSITFEYNELKNEKFYKKKNSSPKPLIFQIEFFLNNTEYIHNRPVDTYGEFEIRMVLTPKKIWRAFLYPLR